MTKRTKISCATVTPCSSMARRKTLIATHVFLWYLARDLRKSCTYSKKKPTCIQIDTITKSGNAMNMKCISHITLHLIYPLISLKGLPSFSMFQHLSVFITPSFPSLLQYLPLISKYTVTKSPTE